MGGQKAHLQNVGLYFPNLSNLLAEATLHNIKYFFISRTDLRCRTTADSSAATILKPGLQIYYI